MLAVTFNSSIGLGSVLTVIAIIAGVTVGYFKWREGDPSEWRENYMAEVTRREDLERQALEQRELKHEAITELAALRARTDLGPLMLAVADIQKGLQRTEERMTTRLDAFETNQKQVATILGALVEQVAGMREAA